MSLDGRLAFVTGAGSGIGRVICQILAREKASIVAADKNVQSAKETVDLLPKSSAQSHLALFVSVENSENVKKSLEDILKKFSKPPSIVVNCAGIVRSSPITKLTEADFDVVIDVNLKATFIVMQTFANAMIEYDIRNGSIVNIGSITGKNAYPENIQYCASKAGVDIMSKVAAKEFGKWNIRVNTVLPGLIQTPLSDTSSEETKMHFISVVSYVQNDRAVIFECDMTVTDVMTTKMTRSYDRLTSLSVVPLARIGRPEEVAEVVAFLASDKSSYVNGASIEVTGGI